MQPYLVGRLVFAQVDTDPARDSQLERPARARRGEGRHRRPASATTQVEAAPAELVPAAAGNPEVEAEAVPAEAATQVPAWAASSERHSDNDGDSVDVGGARALVPSQRDDEVTLSAAAGATPRHRHE